MQDKYQIRLERAHKRGENAAKLGMTFLSNPYLGRYYRQAWENGYLKHKGNNAKLPLNKT